MIVDPVVLVDGSKPINIVVPRDVSDSLSMPETVDSNIEAATVTENEQLKRNNNRQSTRKLGNQKFEGDLFMSIYNMLCFLLSP